MLRRGILAGIVSGVGLGLFLKLIENTQGVKVYTLLLNVDYIPIINTVPLPESIEFLLHLVVSVLLSLSFMLVLSMIGLKPRIQYWFVIAACILIGILLYPTTSLSPRTPELTSLPAISYWLVGHALYGWTLAWMNTKY